MQFHFHTVFFFHSKLFTFIFSLCTMCLRLIHMRNDIREHFEPSLNLFNKSTNATNIVFKIIRQSGLLLFPIYSIRKIAMGPFIPNEKYCRLCYICMMKKVSKMCVNKTFSSFPLYLLCIWQWQTDDTRLSTIATGNLYSVHYGYDTYAHKRRHCLFLRFCCIPFDNETCTD